MFKTVNPTQNLSEMEEGILKFWQDNKIFEKSLEIRKDAPLYSFYDGPPFATGTPHYGHIVASTMKDVVPRFFTMKGFKVERVWGWDCHGLPIENIAERALGIKHKKEIEKLGVEKFNNVCREKVLEYVAEWEKIIPRLGRFVDMKNAYRTMDLSYMESVWWVFKELWDKGLIYEGYRSMHVCPRCETTLSQSEVSEGYRDITDLAVTVKFEALNEVDKNKDFVLPQDFPVYFLVWTTTPWTLIGNVALAVGPEIDYALVKSDDSYYILAKTLAPKIFEDKKYEEIKTFKGSELAGFDYRPIFDYYFNRSDIENHQNGWKIYAANFVSTDEGTGIVHIAPAFGEDDLNLAREKKLPLVSHIGMDGIIKGEIKELGGRSVKPIDDVQKTDREIIEILKQKKSLFTEEQYSHSYPHCWRCETPLINYATSSWFVKVEKLKDEAIKLAKEINWSPQHVKAGRFGKWLEGARDWSISRQRYWASVIPLWRCDKCPELKVIGSVGELEKLSGQKIEDLHKDKIDPVTFPCAKCQGTMRRTPDVLDTWFDSGSMPYAQIHYPFENKEKFSETFPAEFIAEGQDQTRTWFYYLHIIATAIKSSIAYKNVLVNGIVLAENGKKMSKRLQNYPDPQVVIQKYGADALRLYLLTSPVMQAENLNFTEKDLAQVSRGTLRMLWNTYAFFTMYAEATGWQPKKSAPSTHVLDRWILAEFNLLIQRVGESMQNFELTKASRALSPFIEDLSNWYLRRSRKRFQSNNTSTDEAFGTLYFILTELSKVMAPFTPFMAEAIYQNLRTENDEISVHLTKWPEAETADLTLSQGMAIVRDLAEQAHAARAAEKIKVRQPLAQAKIKADIKEPALLEILKDEINVKEITVNPRQDEAIKLDFHLTPELEEEGLYREIVRLVQDFRKKEGLKPGEKVILNYSAGPKLVKVVTKYNDAILKNTKAQLESTPAIQAEESTALGDDKITFEIRK